MPTKKYCSDRCIIFLICFFIMLSFFSIDLINPSLPSIMHHFNTDSDHTQAIGLIYALGLGLSQFVYGPLSDRFGRRSVVFIGTSLCLIGNILAAASHSLLLLMVARFISAFGCGAGMIIARVVLRDQFSGAKLLKAFSYLSMAINISPAVAPVMGGLIQQLLNWRWAFIFLSIWTLIVFVLMAYALPETLPKEKRLSSLKLNVMLSTYRMILSDHTFFYSALLSGTGLAVNLSYLLMSPFLYQLILGFSPAENGTVYIANAVGFFLGAVIVNRLSDRLSALQLMGGGLATCIIGGSLLLIFGLFGVLNLWVLIIPASINSIGLGLVMPSVGTVAFSHLKQGTGMAAALMGGIRLLTVSVCLLLVLFVHEHNQVPMSSLIIIFTGLSLVLYWRLLKSKW